MKRVEVNKLISQKRDIEKDIKRIEDKVSKSCKHNIRFAYYFPYKCEKCSFSYIKYCIENNLAFESRVEYMIYYDKIQAKNAKIEEQKLKQEQLELERKLLEDERMKKAEEDRIFWINMKNRDFFLKHCITNYRSHKIRGKKDYQKEEVGRRYERQIGYIYEQQGMNVSYNGIYNKLQDDGIDLIIKDKKTHLLIQCKNYKEKGQIHSNTIAQLVGDSTTYALENPNVKVHCMLVTSYDNLDDRAREYLKLHSIDHFVKQYSVEYPLIKCKKESMIYHLPCNANYDRIKINIKKGDRYLESAQEAIDKGFKLANN